MKNLLDVSHVFGALLYSGIGLAVFMAAFVAVDRATPYNLWEEIVAKQNRALAGVVGSLSIAIAIIIAASILG